VSLETVRQAKRFFKILAGFTLLFVGVVMLVTPGPGWLVIALGLGLLAAEYVWARRLLNKLKAGGERLRATLLSSTAITSSSSPSTTSTPKTST
jgi:uncharacterized protein (TIGR02611 family)